VGPAAVVVVLVRSVHQPVDDPGVGRLGLVLVVHREVVARRALLRGRRLRERDALAVRTPRDLGDATHHVRHLPRLAAVRRQHPELRFRVVTAARTHEREPVARRAPPRLTVRPLLRREPARLPAEPADVHRVLVVVAVRRPPHERHAVAVRRDPRVRRQREVVVVLRTNFLHASVVSGPGK